MDSNLVPVSKFPGEPCPSPLGSVSPHFLIRPPGPPGVGPSPLLPDGWLYSRRREEAPGQSRLLLP